MAGTVDPDAGQTFTYAIITLDGASLFKISGSQILMATNGLDYESRQLAGFQYVLGVQVTDSGSPALSAQAFITVQIQDVNEAPTITSGTRSVAENSPSRTVVGVPITASDPDLNQLIKLSIDAGDPTGIFKINSCSGQIEVVQAVLDFEGPIPTYTLTVTATDDGTPRLSTVDLCHVCDHDHRVGRERSTCGANCNDERGGKLCHEHHHWGAGRCNRPG